MYLWNCLLCLWWWVELTLFHRTLVSHETDLMQKGWIIPVTDFIVFLVRPRKTLGAHSVVSKGYSCVILYIFLHSGHKHKVLVYVQCSLYVVCTVRSQFTKLNSVPTQMHRCFWCFRKVEEMNEVRWVSTWVRGKKISSVWITYIVGQPAIWNICWW